MRTARLSAPLLAVVLAIPAALHAQAADPVARITAYDKAVNAIETAKLSEAQRLARFVPLVRDSYDMPAIAALVAGPAWAKASAADRAAAIAALTHHSAASLAHNFKGPGATTFTVDPAPIRRSGATVVKVTVGSDTLFYRMRGARIVDVISGGVSNLSLQRADLAATIASGGVPAMTRKLGELDGVR